MMDKRVIYSLLEVWFFFFFFSVDCTAEKLLQIKLQAQTGFSSVFAAF